MGKLDLKKAGKRVDLYASTIGQEPPSKLLCPEGAPSPELLAFCDATGASLDWIFCGDARSMIRDSFARARSTKGSTSGLDVDEGNKPPRLPKQYRDAFNDTDLQLTRMSGCIDALRTLAHDFDGLNCPDKDANSILSLISVVEDGVRRMVQLRGVEWDAIKNVGETS